MSTDGTKITEDEELQRETIRVLKWLVVGAIIFIICGVLIYGTR